MADTPDTERQATDPHAREVLSVTELNDRIASVLEETPALHGVRCIGEVTDLHQNSTALYFTLTDGNAELPCVLWANRYRTMDVDLENGTEVVLEGDIDYWVEGGNIDLKPWEVIVVGDGDRTSARRAITDVVAELSERRFDVDRFDFEPYVESEESAKRAGEKLREIFAEGLRCTAMTGSS